MSIKKWLWTILLFGVICYVGQILHRRSQIVADPVGPLKTDVKSMGPLRFFVIADTGSGDVNQYEVASAMEKVCQQGENIQGILMAGDNFYSKGVSSVDDPQWVQKVERPFGSQCLSKVPIYPVLGNHDYKQDTQPQIDYSKKNPRWKMPHRFYRVDFGNLLRVVGFDSAYPDICLNAAKCSVDFLRENLRSSKTRWTIVFAHHPLSSASSYGYGYRGGLFGFLVRPMVCGKAHAWFSGHSHHLEHRRLNTCDTDLFIVGGGGGDLYKTQGNTVSSRFAQSVHGFAELQVDDSSMTATFFDKSAKRLYSTSIPSLPAENSTTARRSSQSSGSDEAL